MAAEGTGCLSPDLSISEAMRPWSEYSKGRWASSDGAFLLFFLDLPRFCAVLVGLCLSSGANDSLILTITIIALIIYILFIEIVYLFIIYNL